MVALLRSAPVPSGRRDRREHAGFTRRVVRRTEGSAFAAGRPFVVKNEGFNLHNFSVVGTHISIDLRPGTQFAWVRIGAHLPPGTYEVVCTIHGFSMTVRVR